LGQLFEVVEATFGEGEFFGVGPAFELSFAEEGGVVVGEGFGVEEVCGRGFGGCLTTGAGPVFCEASVQVGGGSDVEAVVLEAEDIDVVGHRAMQILGAISLCPSTRCARSGPFALRRMAPEVGLEPTTDRLTADCSTIELLWNSNGRAL
jgi:hypothetical protein